MLCKRLSVVCNRALLGSIRCLSLVPEIVNSTVQPPVVSQKPEELWSWIPPRNSIIADVAVDEGIIPVAKGYFPYYFGCQCLFVCVIEIVVIGCC